MWLKDFDVKKDLLESEKRGSGWVQAGILGWDNGFNMGFRVATLKIGVCGVLLGLGENLILMRIRAEGERYLFLIH